MEIYMQLSCTTFLPHLSDTKKFQTCWPVSCDKWEIIFIFHAGRLYIMFQTKQVQNVLAATLWCMGNQMWILCMTPWDHAGHTDKFHKPATFSWCLTDHILFSCIMSWSHVSITRIWTLPPIFRWYIMHHVQFYVEPIMACGFYRTQKKIKKSETKNWLQK